MPIHRIDLPHIPSSLSQNRDRDYDDNDDDDDDNNNSNSNNIISNSNEIHSNGSSFRNLSQNLQRTTSSLNSSNRYSSINNFNLQKKLSNSNNNSLKSNVQSSTSLLSMLSNQTATTEYSPNIIDDECGDLLKITDLDISATDKIVSNSPKNQNLLLTHRSKVSFDLTGHNYDTESTDSLDDDDYDNDDLSTVYGEFKNKAEPYYNDNNEDDDYSTKLCRQNTSTDVCGSCNDYSINDKSNEFIDYNNSLKWNFNEKWIFVLIGLPACGKSTMIQDFQNYVKEIVSNKVRVKSYNAGDIRRKYENKLNHKFNFNDLKASENLRNNYALEALKNLTNDLINDLNDIGILDATNTTKDRRESIFKYVQNQANNSNIIIQPLLFEIKCTNRALRRFNIEQKSKNKDYIHMNREIAINDFLERIKNYEASYEKVTVKEIKDLNVKYFGIDNVGDSIYYDCGLNHHNNTRHQNLHFTSIALNLLYQFLINYRTKFASKYLTDVDEFYTGEHYHPIKSSFSKPVSIEEVKNVLLTESSKINSSQITNNSKLDTYKLPKVLSSSRLH
ncbi:hypothetical protein C6P40_002706 [Pichia californica]|uniref:6-phosphofructo-2-kinase domain-containing protein n=1 Tax=Pichia californica TaxID=460514 RepID=A0A9P6WQL9_9ASCO|nr:hypothetical protein C6P42_001653 [[Candida] californica]KAG0691315.1 hypothetical protein C6P40_002706 [[Candida] californica]